MTLAAIAAILRSPTSSIDKASRVANEEGPESLIPLEQGTYLK